MKNYSITVCTPTYNRGKLLKRTYNSLKNQTNKDFVWLIIDDGSVDDTEEIINQYKKNSDFPIEYHYKENGGRHTALNYSYEYIKTEWVINLDSDDELECHAIEKIVNILDKGVVTDRFWQISGRCIDSNTRKMIGNEYSKIINSKCGVEQRKLFYRVKGEKSNVRRIDVLRQYPFPVYKDTKFVTENIVWEQIQKRYYTYCTNEVFRIYHQDSEDSLAKGKIHNDTRMISRYHYSIFCLNNLFDELFYNRNVMKAIINAPRAQMCSKVNITRKQLYNDVNNKTAKIILSIIGYPLAWIYIVIMKRK